MSGLVSQSNSRDGTKGGLEEPFGLPSDCTVVKGEGEIWFTGAGSKCSCSETGRAVATVEDDDDDVGTALFMKYGTRCPIWLDMRAAGATP
jgi:hypothetical protein